MTVHQPPSWLQQGSHTANNDRLLLKSLLPTQGIDSLTSLKVTQTSTPALQVQVAAGGVFINGTTIPAQGTYHAYNDATVILTVPTPNTSFARIDLVVMRIRDADVTGTQNTATLEIVPGTASAAPVVPTTPGDSVVLAQYSVAANATSIINGVITDTRPYSTAIGGTIVGKSTARPSNARPGQILWETDTLVASIWTGAAWVGVNRKVLLANQGATVGLTTGFQNLAVILGPPQGKYLMFGTFRLEYSTGASGRTYQHQLSSGGGGIVVFYGETLSQATSGRHTVTMLGEIEVTTDASSWALQAKMDATGGTNLAYSGKLWMMPVDY